MSNTKDISVEEIRTWLDEVMDPEIPVLSLNDLGVITGIEIQASGKVKVNMTPTFSGCPAMDYMKRDVEETLLKNGLPKKRLNYFGLEYKFIRRFLDNELTKDELFELLNIAIHQFAKRQSSWFRRMEKRGVNIHWVEEGNLKTAMQIIEPYLELKENQ